MNKITTNKYFIYLKNMHEIDKTSLVFLIDDTDNMDIDDMLAPEILFNIISSVDLSKIKYQITLLIKYLIENYKTYKKDIQLKEIVDGITDPKHIPFLGYFHYLYHNIMDVKIKYKRKEKDFSYIYYYDKFYLD
tara:strand:+ start:932 stop:1333 length:402 start_codon:yes stop_codon:yes gene_type:complete